MNTWIAHQLFSFNVYFRLELFTDFLYATHLFAGLIRCKWLPRKEKNKHLPEYSMSMNEKEQCKLIILLLILCDLLNHFHDSFSLFAI